MTTVNNATPEQRLASSRQAIVSYMTRQGDESGSGEGAFGHSANHAGGSSVTSVWKALRRATLAWWRHHPAHLAIDVAVGMAKPVLGKYAHQKPLQLLGISAAVGAAAVLVRPWRLVSVTGLLLATVKSSGLTPALLSLISAPPEPTDTSESLEGPPRAE